MERLRPALSNGDVASDSHSPKRSRGTLHGAEPHPVARKLATIASGTGRKPRKRSFLGNAAWHAEASVWAATSVGLPALVAEAVTTEELPEVIRVVVPPLLHTNRIVAPAPHGNGPIGQPPRAPLPGRRRGIRHGNPTLELRAPLARSPGPSARARALWDRPGSRERQTLRPAPAPGRRRAARRPLACRGAARRARRPPGRGLRKLCLGRQRRRHRRRRLGIERQRLRGLPLDRGHRHAACRGLAGRNRRAGLRVDAAGGDRRQRRRLGGRRMG